MPISPQSRRSYPCDWDYLSWHIVVRRAERRCECTGQCGRSAEHLAGDGRCRNVHGQKRWRGKPWQRPVILSVMHLDHNPAGRDPELMIAGCEGCHLAHDAGQHAETKRLNRERELGLVPLW